MAIKNFVEELEWRGMIHSIMPGTQEQLQKEMSTAYVGIDPTADSLHIGHLVSVMILKHFQMCGHRPIALVGGATGMIGDPSGKSQERNLLDEKTLRHNQEAIKKQLAKLLDFESDAPNAAMLVNNYDWMKGITFLDFIRDIGKLITVNYMMAKDSVKKRFNGEGEGMSFTEFTYQLVQAYDFLHLYETVGCKLQLGGADQWGNITTGTELIRRKLGKDAYAMTITLLTDSQGKKMGKTAGNAVWLDPNKTSPFEFYQYWRNVGDADVLKCIRMLTFLPLEQIDEMDSWEGSKLNEAKEILAYELTSMVHGEEEAKKAQEGARAVFSTGSSEHMPTSEISAEDFTDDKIDIVTLLVKAELAKTRNEGRRAVEQGGVSVDGEKITDPKYAVEKAAFGEDGIVLKKGKKNFKKICVK